MTEKQVTPEKKNGRPKIEFNQDDWKRIELLCSIQCTAEEIASVMGCSVDTISRRVEEAYHITFAEHIKKHALGGNASLRRIQFTLAKKNATMAIWLGKQYLGQQDYYTPNTGEKTPDPIKFVFKDADDGN